LFVLALGGVAQAAEKPKPAAPDPNRAVATVNGAPIPAQKLRQALEERIPATGHRNLSDERLAQIRFEVLDRLIIEEVLYQEAKRRKIKVDATERDKEIKAVKARFRSEQDYRDTLKAKGMTDKDIQLGIERYLAIRKLTDLDVRSKIKVTDEQMRQYYNENPEKFRLPQQVRVKTLLVAVDPAGSKADWEQAQAKAQGFADRVKKGEDFATLIKQHSDDEFGRSIGGDTGTIHEGRLPYRELEAVVYDQPVGKMSDPVRTLYGYVVYRVEEKQPPKQMRFEDLNKDLFRKEMENSAAEDKIRVWVTDLRAKADVKIH
jgi:parvulin-like peptidyl-prolyl isomerase